MEIDLILIGNHRSIASLLHYLIPTVNAICIERDVMFWQFSLESSVY